MTITLINEDTDSLRRGSNMCLPTLGSTDALFELIKTTYKFSAVLQSLIPDELIFQETVLTIIKNYVYTNPSLNMSDVSFDILVENERGMKIFGISWYSSMFLIPTLDPVSQFTDLQGCTVGNDLKIYSTNCIDMGYSEETGAMWKWSWVQWFVLCFNGDVNTGQAKNKRAIFCDYEGWFYSRGFRSKRWCGEYSYWRGMFCRRRLLIRLKERIVS